jgi:glycosyltransferase involved in cell wall biosynthesis
MKILMLYEYPPVPAGLSTQGDLLFRGLCELGVDARAAHLESNLEKEWHYRTFAPDIAIGVGYWGYAPNIIVHPQRYGVQAVPWLVANGYVGNYLDTLNALPLIFVTSSWVRDVYLRDGVRPDGLEVLPVGIDMAQFTPRAHDDPQVRAVRDALGIAPDELMLLTIGGDAASKGAREVMHALARLGGDVPPWKYVCKVWPQQRTVAQNQSDRALAEELGIADRFVLATNTISRNFVPYLLSACDVYVGPSRLEGFGMPHVEANACGRPVLAIDAMAFRDTLVHEETALLASVAIENRVGEKLLGPEDGYPDGRRVVFNPPRIVDYRADVADIARHLGRLLADPALRARLGEAGRARVAARYDYHVVAARCIELLTERVTGVPQLRPTDRPRVPQPG